MSFRAGHGRLLLIATMFVTGCRPAPPPDAPADVHYIGGKTPYWRHCAVDPSDRQVHCRTWIGHRLSLNEVFLPYDGGPTPALEELEIFDNQGINPDIWVFLNNGRILIPVSKFEWSKQLLQNEWADIVDERGYRIPP